MTASAVALFTPVADADRVLDALHEVAPRVIVDRDPVTGVWRSAIVPSDDGDESRWPLRINHAPDYYEEPGWTAQLDGLRVHLGRLAADRRGDEVVDQVGSFRSAYSVSLSCRLDLTAAPDDDPRLRVLFDLAAKVGAVLFTPDALYDAEGRVLVGSSGSDPDAVLPTAAEPIIAPPVRVPAPTSEPSSEAGPAVVPDPSPEKSPEPISIFAATPPAPPEGNGETSSGAEGSPSPIDLREPVPSTGPPVGLQPVSVTAPSARQVALRALALAAVCSRAFLEQDDPDEVDQEGDRQRIERWAIEIQGLDEELEPDEWQILQAGIEMLDDRAGVDAAWRIEGLAVLVWALGLAPLPPYDVLADADALNDAIGYLDAHRANALVASAHLMPRERLDAVCRQARAIHWRLREFRLQPAPIDFVTTATDSLLGSMDVSWCRFVNDDLALRSDAGDVAIIDADDDVVDQVQSVAYERYVAATWLLHGGTYSNVQIQV